MRTRSRMMALALALVIGCDQNEESGNAKGTPAPEATANAQPTKPDAACAVGRHSARGHGAGLGARPRQARYPGNPRRRNSVRQIRRADAQIEGDALRFRLMADGNPTGEMVEIHLVEPGKTFEGLNLTVKPDQEAGTGLPFIMVSNPMAASQPLIEKGYALTLEVGKREKGRAAGKLFLSLPGEGKQFLAGTFNAEWLRGRAELPADYDAPFIRGALQAKNAPDPYTVVGYVRVEPHEGASSHLDAIGTKIGPGGFLLRSESRPRSGALFPETDKEPARFEFTRLEPGRYFVFATLKMGPAAWRWVNVAAGGQIVADFTLDQSAFGSLEVAAPPTAGPVSVLPLPEGGQPWAEMLISDVAKMMELQAAGPVAKFGRVAPGKYQVWAGGLTSTVEVKANDTARVELKK